MKLKKWLQNKLNIEGEEDTKKLIIQFIKFGLVGVSNTAVSFGCYYLFLWINQDLYLVGSILGTILSIANAFFWNDRFVFKGHSKEWKSKLKRLGKTYVSYGGTSLLGFVLLLIEVDLLGISKALVPVINLFITIPLNYIVNKFWTFGEK